MNFVSLSKAKWKPLLKRMIIFCFFHVDSQKPLGKVHQMVYHWNPTLCHSSKLYDFLDQYLKVIICLCYSLLQRMKHLN